MSIFLCGVKMALLSKICFTQQGHCETNGGKCGCSATFEKKDRSDDTLQTAQYEPCRNMTGISSVLQMTNQEQCCVPSLIFTFFLQVPVPKNHLICPQIHHSTIKQIFVFRQGFYDNASDKRICAECHGGDDVVVCREICEW